MCADSSTIGSFRWYITSCYINLVLTRACFNIGWYLPFLGGDWVKVEGGGSYGRSALGRWPLGNVFNPIQIPFFCKSARNPPTQFRVLGHLDKNVKQNMYFSNVLRKNIKIYNYLSHIFKSCLLDRYLVRLGRSSVLFLTNTVNSKKFMVKLKNNFVRKHNHTLKCYNNFLNLP